MVEDERVKAYRGNYVPGGGYPLALVAAGRRDQELVGEYFLFLGDKESTFYTQRLVVRSEGIAIEDTEHPKVLGPDFMLEFVAHAAEERLNNHLYQANRANPQAGFWERSYTLREVPVAEAAFLRLEDRYTREIESLAQDTCFPLLSRLADKIYRIGKARHGDAR